MVPVAEQPIPVTGIVLAGGRSTRFGDASVNKATTALEGRTLLERVTDAVATATNRSPVVAVRTEAQRVAYADVLAEHDHVFAFDSPAFEGPLAGLIGALEAVDTAWIFACGCDMPLLSVEAVEWLVEELPSNIASSRPTALAVQHTDGTIDPMHALYRRSSITAVRELVPRSGGVRSLLTALDRVRVVPITAAPRTVPLAESVINTNTRSELAQVSERLEESS